MKFEDWFAIRVNFWCPILFTEPNSVQCTDAVQQKHGRVFTQAFL